MARGVATAQAAAAAEQIQIQVPIEKVSSISDHCGFVFNNSVYKTFLKKKFQVGLIIGRMGDTIKSLQAKTGARIQVVDIVCLALF